MKTCDSANYNDSYVTVKNNRRLLVTSMLCQDCPYKCKNYLTLLKF